MVACGYSCHAAHMGIPTPALISRQVALELRLGLKQGTEPGKPGCTSASGNPRQIARISEVTSQSQQKLASLMVCQAKHYSSWWEAVMPAQGSWWFGQKRRRPLSSQLQPKPTASILQSYKDRSLTKRNCLWPKCCRIACAGSLDGDVHFGRATWRRRLYFKTSPCIG